MRKIYQITIDGHPVVLEDCGATCNIHKPTALDQWDLLKRADANLVRGVSITEAFLKLAD